MKLLNHSLKARLLSLLAACAALLLATPLPGLHAQKSRDESQNVTRWEYSDNGLKRRFETCGKPEFTDDYTDIKSVSEGVAAVYLDDPTLRDLFFQTIASIDSDYERRGVLTALVKTKNQSEEVLRLLLDSAAGLGSDYEKATFLVEVSNVYTGDTRLRSAFLKAVETIKSDYERGRGLSALLKNKQIG